MSINFYNHIKKKETVLNPNYNSHGLNVPFRMLIAAPSGSGKSNMCLNLIHIMNKTFHEIIICVKSADEPLYEMLDTRLKGLVQIYESGEVPPIETYSIKDENTGKLKRIDKKQRLIIFDDLILDKKANAIAAEYYIKARKLGFSMVYIGQSFFQIKPKMIRDNCQYFILGKNLLKKDLRLILTCFPSELKLDDFVNLYNQLTEEPMSCVLIDIEKRTIRRNIDLNNNDLYKL